MKHIENSEEFEGLSVMKGVVQPPIINPYLQHKKRKEYSVAEFVDGILKGDMVLLSRAVTLIESANPEHYAQAQEVIEKCLPYASNSVRLGITGVPGAGKSSLIEKLGLHIVEQKRKLAVLAIDPSSERTKGSILGDKTRMEELSRSENAFIRPSPSAGSLGGVARKTRETIVLCEAAGFNTIIVETVGVGQSETAVHSMVDFFLLLQLAGTGDELQGIKRGIMEMADGIAINKTDGNNVERALAARTMFQNALKLFPAPESNFPPEVLNCSAQENTGIAAVWEMITHYTQFTKQNGFFDKNRNRQANYLMYSAIDESLHSQFYQNEQVKILLKQYEEKIKNNQISSFMAAQEVLQFFLKHQHQRSQHTTAVNACCI